jgi:hypothetical protein
VAEISDAYMQEQLGRTREYAVVLLRASEQYGREGRHRAADENVTAIRTQRGETPRAKTGGSRVPRGAPGA